MNVIEILSAIPFYKVNRPIHEHETINQIQMDHRLIEQGDMFICIEGFTVDGHDFADQAVRNGAAVLVVQREIAATDALVIQVPDTTKTLALLANAFYHYPTTKMPIVGITGTNGKTTITYLLEQIFQKAQQKTGVIGTIQVKIGNKSEPVKNTTPDALQLQRIFYEMVQEKVTIAMMEVSSHALDLGRVYGCDFDIAVFTNLTQDHLDYHQTMEDYLRAKTLLFTGLGNGYGATNKYAVLNADDKHSETIKRHTSQPIVTYGIEQQADIMATDITYKIDGMHFTLVTPNGMTAINTPLIGKFNIYNLLAATAVALLQNVPLETITSALRSLDGVPGRFELVQANQPYTVIVDYAHTPDSLENVLTTIHEFAQRKIYVVVGTGGDRDKTKRPLMADVALSYGDWVIFTSDNPRTEDPAAILDDMVRHVKHSNFEVIENRKAAIASAVQMAESGDVILIAGKGHETYQEVNGVRYDFDDRLIAKEAIEKREH